jgi:tetratricopeptide (TPR) repeat protein
MNEQVSRKLLALGNYNGEIAQMNSGHRIRVFLLGVALLGVTAGAAADTIVLKNGRRIIAMSVVEEGDKVKYLTSAGELSLPKSIVDHIERGGAVPMMESAASAAANLAIAPPTVQPRPATRNEEIERGAVHDGSIDREYIAKLEAEARSGTKQAGFNAAIGHHAAAIFELGRGDMEHALTDERTALNFAPEEPALLMNAAYIHLRRSEYKQALDYLERAKRQVPEDADVAKLTGWSYYGLNKLDQAVAEWRRALALRPDRDVQQALEEALRDKQEEETYKENESAHFKLRYSGAAEPALAHDVLRTLEMHFSAIESELNYTPPESIGVILYTQEAFTDITRAPSWAGALYDGRIRVPVQGLTGVDQELSRSLKHELTHSFIAQKTRSACMALAASCAIRAPTWIQEGLAQWMEGQRSGENAAVLVQIYDQHHAVPLGQLECDWIHMDKDTARYSYAWALANIEYIVQADGMGDIERILDRIGSGMATEAALREVLHSDYNDLMQSTVEYLRKTYVR